MSDGRFRPYGEPVGRWITVGALVAVCSVVLWRLGLPTPMLFGGLLGSMIYSIARPAHDLELPSAAFRLGQAIVGVVIGTAVDWGSLAALGSRWVIVALVACFSVLVSISIGQLLVRRGATRVTATFSLIAGGAAGLTAMADDLGADDRVVAVLQYLRLLAVLVTLPAVVVGVFGASPERVAGPDGSSPIPTTLLVVVPAVAVGVPLAQRFRLPAPALLGPLAVASILGLLPAVADLEVPVAVEALGYLAIGVHIGLRFTVRSLASIGRMLPVAILTIVVTLVACAGLGWVLAVTTGVGGLDAYLATTPGGIYAVTGTAAAVGGDVTFVTAAQVLRLLIILVSAPVLASWLRAGEGDGVAADSDPPPG